MPKTGSFRVKSNNSTLKSAPNSAKTVSVPQYLINDLFEISSSLKGEEAIEELIRFIDYPNDSESGAYTLKAVVRFYSNVRYLTEKIKEVVNL